MSRVALTTVEEGIAVLGLQDKESQNTFSESFMAELLEQLHVLATDNSVRVGVVRGLPDVFCAGANEQMLVDLAQGNMVASDIMLPRVVLDLPIPMIAAMEGHAVGGGLAFALCCDMVLMARESRYGCSFMNLGFTPGMATTRLLQFALGPLLANEMLFGGQMHKGSHFEGRSGINYVVPRAEVWGKAMKLARRIAEKPRHALESLKRYQSLPRRQMFEETRTIETMMHQLSFSHPETMARIQENYAGSVSKVSKVSKEA